MNDERVGGLALLASAIARRTLQVAAANPGELAWTDGNVVFVDANEPVHSLVVQASLLAAGSLNREVVHSLARRPAMTRRYLAVEGHRALAAVEHLLPASARSLIRADLAALSSSPEASLALARGRVATLDPPASFGTICHKPLLAALQHAKRARAIGTQQANAARTAVELADDAISDDSTDDTAGNALGGGGAIGRWLAKLLRPVRQARGGGTPGADAPTHWTRSGKRGSGALALVTTSTVDIADGSASKDRTRGTLYPEWNVHTRSYHENFCTVREVEPALKLEAAPRTVSDRTGLRRALARIGLGVDRYGRQPLGDDIDIDALVEARVEILAGSTAHDAIFIDSLRRRRNLSVLVLLDISGSAGEPGSHGQTVHVQQRTAAASLLFALHELGDRVALYAYHSQGRSSVQLMPVKRFGEDPGVSVMRRLHSLEPGAYSRLGAAIRHGTHVLRTRGGTPRQLLVVLSDGLAYDHGYEPIYGAADARRALGEARQQGVGCLCLSVGASTDAEALRRVFGSSAHASLAEPAQLKNVIGPLFRSALRSADLKRRID